MTAPASNLDRIHGVLYGCAIGDALGLPAEHLLPDSIARRWPSAAWPHQFEATGPRPNGERWDAGEWSDDTDQSLCILRAFAASGPARGFGFANALSTELRLWFGTQLGCGSHTRAVLEHVAFGDRTSPFAASEAIWRSAPESRRPAPNGAVMRAPVVGVLASSDISVTLRLARDATEVTHMDPRCVASAQAVALAVSKLVNGTSISKIEWYVEDEGLACAPQVSAAIHAGYAYNIESLNLGRLPFGYTYKTMAAGFWAIGALRSQTRPSVGEVLRRVIRAGGDTDTNAAVAGAMMGAVVGISGLPEGLVNGLKHRERLDQALAVLLE